jgi:hypothetical protein
MEAFDQLVETCGSWRHWTEQEGEAIDSGDWAKVNRCQAEKQRLQPAIDAHIRLVRMHAERNHAPSIEILLRSLIGGLIALENQNHERLGQQRAELSNRRNHLDTTTRNLRRVQACYAGRRGPVWQSYS